MKKIFYIILALLISLAHIFILNSWLDDMDISHPHKELSYEGGDEGPISVDSIVRSPNIHGIKASQILR